MPNYISFKFNGIKKDWLYIERGRRKAPFAPRRRNIISVSGYPGGYLESTDIEPLSIIQPIGFKVTSDEEALSRADELANWLITDEPVPLEFDDEPGRIYYAVVQNTLDDFEKIATLRSGSIQFICPDPHKYGPELEAIFSSDVTNVTVNGTAPTKPVFELEVLNLTTFAMIQNQLGQYMMIGRPSSLDDNIVEPYTTILQDTCSSTVGWTEGNDLVDGIKTGSIQSNDGKIRALDYGTGPAWHGPVVKKSLSEPVQDFNIQVMINFNENIADNTGRLQISLLDVNNNVIGMLSFFDTYPKYFDKVGRAEIGNQLLVSDRNENWSNTFVGRLTLQRKGQEIVAKIQQYRNGKFIDTIEGKFIDYLNQHQTPIAQVQLHFGAYGENTRPFMAVDNIQVLQINDTTNAVPYIVQVGDLITFDHRDKSILINGEPRKDIKQFGATYFDLQPGDNQLVVMPSDSFHTKVKYREAYK
ncbi:distal tail protein Dit [Gracilibacillus marinus]|uniref:Distal tail protein Dit n=1 Tax=Gracilibacillus marinus TaxID=630535 RepID=A0ABV8VU71_9BACI